MKKYRIAEMADKLFYIQTLRGARLPSGTVLKVWRTINDFSSLDKAIESIKIKKEEDRREKLRNTLLRIYDEDGKLIEEPENE